MCLNSGPCSTQAVQSHISDKAAHKLSWKVVNKHSDEFYKRFKSKSSADLDETLPGELETWLDTVWTASNEGVRRRHLEHLFIWCRLETLGILTAIQRDWLLAFVTKILWEYKGTAAVVFINMNRAEQFKYERDEDDKNDDSAEESEGECMSVRDASRDFQK